MCCNNFCTGMVVGIAAGTCLGIRLKAKERRSAGALTAPPATWNTPLTHDTLNIWIFPKKFPKLP